MQLTMHVDHVQRLSWTIFLLHLHLASMEVKEEEQTQRLGRSLDRICTQSHVTNNQGQWSHDSAVITQPFSPASVTSSCPLRSTSTGSPSTSMAGYSKVSTIPR